MSETATATRSRRGRHKRAPEPTQEQNAGGARYRQLRNPFAPVEIFSADQIEAIHETALKILEEIGLKVLSDEARGIYRAAGASVDEGEKLVRFDRGLIEASMGTAPPQVTLHARNPARNATLGANHVAFAMVGGPPHVSDLERGRRAGTLADFEDLMRLGQAFDVIHLLSPSVEPVDTDQATRHLQMGRAMAVLSDKAPFVYSRGAQAVEDALEIVRLARGVTPEVFAREPGCYTVVNANSPLQLDTLMCNGIIETARRGQLMVLTPFTLAGAMAPVTIPGALAQQHAEALAGISLSQIVQPGAPVGYGGFTSNVDMKSGAPAFGTPEYVKAAFASGQLARRLKLPFRSSNVNTSNAPDAQSAYESQMAIWGALFGGCNLLLHGAGWIEGGLTASFEKIIIDVEMLQMMASLFEPVVFDKDTLALEAIREVGPASHFFGAAHTLARYQDAFYSPLLSDWRNFESWRDDGAVDATQRAHRIYKETLAAFTPPPIEPDRLEAIDAFIAKRTEEGGAVIT